MEEEINFKSKEKTQLAKNKENTDDTKTIKVFSNLDKNSQKEKNSIFSENINTNILKEKNNEKSEFEEIYEIENPSELVDLIENFNLSKLGTYINSAIKNPDNTIIILINPKNSLMEMLDCYKKNKTEYDFKLTKIFKMWDIIVELSKNIRDRELECNTFDIELDSPLMVVNKIKIFFAGNYLEYLLDITKPITNENNDKFFLPIIERCMRFQNKEQMDLYNCIKQLKDAIETNKNLFPDGYSNENKYTCTQNSEIPGHNFYRIVIFTGVVTEKIIENDFDNLLIKFKKSSKIVFNYFNYEYDYQLEKKVYNIFKRNNLLDFKFEDFHFFMKPEEDLEMEMINNYKEKVGNIENLISNYFISFNKIKNVIFKNEEFIKFAEAYELQHKKLNDDYHIIKINYKKCVDNNKNILNTTEANNIKKNFEDMLRKKIITNHLNEVKGNIDFKKLEDIIDKIESEIKSKSNDLIKDLNKDLDNIKYMSNFIFIFSYFYFRLYL